MQPISRNIAQNNVVSGLLDASQFDDVLSHRPAHSHFQYGHRLRTLIEILDEALSIVADCDDDETKDVISGSTDTKHAKQ